MYLERVCIHLSVYNSRYYHSNIWFGLCFAALGDAAASSFRHSYGHCSVSPEGQVILWQLPA